MKNRANDVAALLKNWKQVESAMNTAMNAEGSASKENEIYMKSIEGHLNTLTAAWQALSNTIIKSGSITDVLETVTNIVNVLDILIDKVGVFPTLVGGFSAIMSGKNIGFLTNLDTELTGITNKLGLFGKSFKTILNDLHSGQGIFTGLFSKTITKTDVDCITKFINQLNMGVPVGKAWKMTMIGATDAGKKMAVEVRKGSVSLDFLTKSVNTSKLATIGLKAATIALNMALTMGFAVAIQKAISGLDKLIHYQEDAARKAQEKAIESQQSADANREEYNSLEELIQKYKELASSDVRDSSTRKEIQSIQNQIVDLVGSEADGLNLVNGELEEQLGILEKIRLQKLYGSDPDSVVSSAKQAYGKSKTAYEKYDWKNGNAIGDALSGLTDSENNTVTIDYFGDNKGRNKAIDIINKKWNELNYGSASIDSFSVFDTYSKLTFNPGLNAKERLEALDEAIKALQNEKDFDYLNNGLWNKLVELREEVSGKDGVISKQIEAANNLMNVLSESEISKDDGSSVDSLEKYKEYRQKLIDNVLNDNEIKDAIGNGLLNEEDVANNIDATLGSLEQFSDYYNQWRESFSKTLSTEDANVVREMFSQYSDIVEEFNKFELEDPTQTIFGNIDTNNRYRLQWTKDSLEQYKEAIQSWDNEARENWNEYVNNVNGSFSTVYGGSGEYEGVEIAFSPMLQTDEGAKLLSRNTVDQYIHSLISEAGDDWTNEDLFNLDAKGLIIDGERIHGLIADIGETARRTGEIMHFVGEDGAINDAYKNLDEYAKSVGVTVEELFSLLNDTPVSLFGFDFEQEESNIESFFSAIKESVSSVGLSSETIDVIKEKYKSLGDVDASKLFEQTANGINLNVKAVRKLESEYEDQRKWELNSNLEALGDRYNSLTAEINNTSDAARKAELYSRRSDILNQISDTSDLISQYDGLTSAFNKWEQAQSIGEEGDMYDSLADGLKDIKELYNEGLVGTNKFRTAVQLMSNEDLSTASIDELIAAYDSGYQKMTRYFTDGQKGCKNFLTDLQDINSEWASMNEDGSWDINIGNDKDVADALGINVESVQAVLKKARDFGFDINISPAANSIELLESEVEKANRSLINLGKTDVIFDFNSKDLSDVNSQILEAQELLDSLVDSNGELYFDVSDSDYENAKTILGVLIAKRQELSAPCIMSIDTSNAESQIENAVKLLQDYQTNYNDLEINTALGADTTEAQTNIQNVLTQLNEVPDDVKVALGINDESLQLAIESITNTSVDVSAGVNLDQDSLDLINSTIAGITPTMMVEAGLNSELIDGYVAPEKDAEVVYDVDDHKIKEWNPPRKYSKVYYDVVTRGGRTDAAFANGTSSTKDSGNALVGELGQELVVRDGKYFTIGDNSAELFRYQKGDIIFNAEQTRQILETGKISSGSKRGKAYADGTAFGSGSGWSGSGSFHGSSSGGSSSSSSSSSNKHKNKSSSKSSESNDSSKEDFEETFDWIEIAIDRIERAISKLDLKTKSVYKSWNKRNISLKEQISKIGSEVSLQQRAYERYMSQANSVGLSDDLISKVKNGEIDVETIEDKDLAEQIKDFQDWYDKALECKDAVDSLNESVSDLYNTAFDDVVSQFDGILGSIEHEKSMIDEYISQSEAKGNIVSTEYYNSLKRNEENNIEKLRQEKESLLSSLESAVSSGAIEKGSEAWYDMISKIDDVTLSIEESKTAMLEYSKSIQEINWKVFDILQEKIGQVTDESSFLIELIGKDKMYNDKGQITNEGMSVMGLHGTNYSVYMEQSKKYAQEMQNIEKQIANDPYNQDLINRRQELLELQRESILAAEDEKQAIIGMVREGIELELNSLQKLIDSYSEAMDSQKSLYDYQKQIAEQTKNISTLEKQMSAYKGDNSEEAKAQIQKIKISLEEAKNNLEETQYNRYISDTKQMFDNLYLEYETLLNSRLDNTDALFEEMIANVNANSDSIVGTITSQAEAVGYKLSEDMSNIWNSNTTSITDSVNHAVNEINVSLQTMIEHLGNIAKSQVSSEDTSSASGSSEANAEVSTPESTPTIPESSEGNESNLTDKDYYGVALAIWNGGYGWGEGRTRNNRLEAKGFDVDKLYSIINQMEREGYIHSGSWSGRYYGITDLKPYHYNRFAVGVHNLNRKQLAWTQENGSEMIVRPSDGAILTPLAKNDSVLTSKASNNIWDMSNNPTDFIRDNLNVGALDTSIAKDSYVSYSQNLENVVFNFPNVKNYDEMLKAMQHDKDFEKLIMAMTIDKVMGGSSLAKGKAIRK